jgi:ABC-2 type transport system permease protein
MSPQRPSRRVQLWSVLRKESLQTVRDRRVMFMLLVAPLLQLVVFGFAVDYTVDRVPTAIADLDQTRASREHARRLLADGTLARVGGAASPAEAERALELGTAAAAVILPVSFERDLSRGQVAEVQVLIDGADPNRATVAAAAASGYFGAAGLALAQERLSAQGGVGRPGSVAVSPRIRFNPALRTPPFMIPGILGMLLIVVTTIVTAMGLAREREMGTLEQVLVTPIHPTILLLGKMLPFVAIGCVVVMLGLAVGTWVFDVPLHGSLGVLVASTLFYLMTTLGVGLLISTVSATQQQAFLGGFLFALPAILLSGVMTPIRSMPGWMQALTYLNPVRYFVEVLRGSLLRGAGASDLWTQMAALAAFGVLILGFASIRFHKRAA